MSNRSRSGRRIRRTGAATTWIEPSGSDPMTRLGKRVTPKPNGCWAFDDNLDEYGRFSRKPAHRWVWEAINGPVDRGDHIHHTCLHPGCVNPGHLARLSASEHAALHAELRRTA